jgi:ABC-type glycerol-3-phosphate transport system substrate-binding protein
MVYEFGEAGYLAQVDKYLNDPVMTPAFFDSDDILPAYWGLGKTPKGTYAVPVAGESIFVAYRTDLFAKYNKQIPKSMDELLDLAKFFNGKDNMYGIAIRGNSGAHAGVPWMSVAYCFTDSPVRNMKTGSYNVNNPDSIKVFQYVADLAKNAPRDVTSYTHEEATAAFAQGKTAMWLDATTLAATIENPASSSVAGKVDYFVIPDGPAGGSGAVGGWTLAVTSDAPNPDPAWAFIMFVTSKAKSVEYSERGGAPNRKSIFENPQMLAKFPFYKRILEAVTAAGHLQDRGLTYMYDSPYFNDFRFFIGTELNRVEAGEINVATAAANVQRNIDEVLAETK